MFGDGLEAAGGLGGCEPGHISTSVFAKGVGSTFPGTGGFAVSKSDTGCEAHQI